MKIWDIVRGEVTKEEPAHGLGDTAINPRNVTRHIIELINIGKNN